MRAIRVIAAGIISSGLALALTTPERAAAGLFTYATDFNGFPAGWTDQMQNQSAPTEECGLNMTGTINMRPSVISAFGDGSVLSSQYGRRLAVYFETDEAVTITHVGVDGDMGSGDNTNQYIAIVACDSQGQTYVVDASGNGITIDQNVSWTNIVSVSISTVPSQNECLIESESGWHTTPPCHYAWIDAFSITADAATDPFDGVGGSGGGEILYRPVLEAETLEVAASNQPNIITAEADTWVHAAASGVVTSIAPSGAGNRVTVESADYSAQYVNLAFVYAEVGDQIAGGCILGRIGGQILSTTATYSYPIGQVGFEIDDAIGPMIWQNFPDPTDSSGCSDANATANCLTANPKLDDYADRWSTTGQPSEDTVLLESGQKLAQYLTLTAGTDYYLTIIASSASGGLTTPGNVATIKWQLGDQNGVVSFDKDADWAILEIGPITPTVPDLPPDVYALTLMIPDYSEAVSITFVCLSDGSAQVAPEACYFPNSDFARQGTDGWTLSAGIVDASPTHPFVSIPQNDSISHSILLYGYADANADYRLRVVGRTDVADVSFSFTDIAQYISNGFETDLTVTYEVASVPVETLANLQIINVIIFSEYRTIFTVPQADTWDGDLVAVNESATADDIEIRQICVSPASGVWPGYETADSPGANRDCSFPQPPITLNPAEWIDYSIAVLLWLWYCVIAAILGSIAAGIASAVVTLGMMGRWLGSLLAVTTGFMLGLLSSGLQGMLDSLAAALGAAWGLIADLPIMEMVFDLLTLAAALATLATVAITSLLTMLLRVGGAIGALAAMSANGWLHLGDAINNATAAVSGPNCGNPEDPLIGLCYGLNAIGTIVQEFPVFAASTYIMSGSIGLRTVIWTVRVFGKVMNDV